MLCTITRSILVFFFSWFFFLFVHNNNTKKGKSTLFKQMKILAREGGYTETELHRYKASIYNNCISQMQVLCEHALEQETEFDSKQNKDYCSQVLQLTGTNDVWTAQLCSQLEALWADSGVQRVFAQPAVKAILNESASYFFGDLSRFRDPDGYTPTKQDVLRARVRSTGIEEAEFRFDELKFRMLDVGGQRNERRKWIHCFSMDHQLLSNRGFLWAHEVQQAMASGDEPLLLAGYSEASNTLVWEAPLAFIHNNAEDFPQPMVRFVAAESGIDLLCTPQHDMYVHSDKWTHPGFSKVKAGRLLDAAGAQISMMGAVRQGLKQQQQQQQNTRDFVQCLQLNSEALLEGFLLWLGQRVFLNSSAVTADTEWLRFCRAPGAVDHILNQLSGAELRHLLSPFTQGQAQGSIHVQGWSLRDLLVRVMFLAGYSAVFELLGACRSGMGCSDRTVVVLRSNDYEGDDWVVCWKGSGDGATNIETVSEEVYQGATWCVTMPSGFVVARRASALSSSLSSMTTTAVAASAPVVVGNCFDAVTVVLFCASLSEYDQTLREDPSQNRMSESLLLFDEIVNSPWFRKTPIVLFLNKTDLFKEKIWKVPLSVCFSNYRGANEPKEAMEYIRSRFEELPQDRSRVLYIHFTCAVSTENVEVVFRVVKETLLKEIIYNFAI